MAEERHSTWLADVVLAFRAMEDGRAWLQDIYDWIRSNRKNQPKNFASVIRATIYAHSSDAAAYVSGNPDVFRNIARGLWGLRFPEESAPNKSNVEAFVVVRMRTEDIANFAGSGAEFVAEINRRADALRKKYGITASPESSTR